MAKSFAWSFSKIKNFETCPKRHYEVDIARNYRDEDSDELIWGNKVHKALALACQGKQALPEDMASFQPWVDKVKATAGVLKVEQKYAITKGLLKTSWFGDNAWYRGIGDIVQLNPPVAFIRDWKTGKPKPDDKTQLMLMAACVFAHFNDIQAVVSQYVWLKEDPGDVDLSSTVRRYDRRDMPRHWLDVLPRVEAYEKAIREQSFPPMPGGLCKRYCPVTSCPYHGKGSH